MIWKTFSKTFNPTKHEKIGKYLSENVFLLTKHTPTPINSFLDDLLTYMMSLLPIPPGVIKRLDNIRRVVVVGKERKERVPLGKREMCENYLEE